MLPDSSFNGITECSIAALKIAPGVLPVATVVRTTDVETVEGNTQRHRNPSRSALGSEGQMMRVISWNASKRHGFQPPPQNRFYVRRLHDSVRFEEANACQRAKSLSDGTAADTEAFGDLLVGELLTGC